MRPRNQLISVSLVSTLMLTGCIGTTGDDSQVITYNTPSEWANWGAVLDAFSEETGIDAPNDPKNSGQALAALEAEASAPAADVAYLGLVFGLEAEDSGLLDELPSGVTDGVPDNLVSQDNRWTTVHEGAVAFLVNTDAIGDREVPQCWEDLTDTQYDGMVGFLEPDAAAVGYSVLTAVNLALGGTPDDWEPGLGWAEQMHELDLALPSQTATSALQQGEIPILIDADFNGYQLANDAEAPIEVVLPCEGTISMPYVAGKVAGSPNEEAADTFLEFVMDDEAQQLFAEYYLRPVRDVEIDPEVSENMLPDSDYEDLVINPDFRKLHEVQNDVLDLWAATK